MKDHLFEFCEKRKKCHICTGTWGRVEDARRSVNTGSAPSPLSTMSTGRSQISKQLRDEIFSTIKILNVQPAEMESPPLRFRLAASFIEACRALELPGAVFSEGAETLSNDSDLMELIRYAYVSSDFGQVLDDGE
jgi:hypothetical protein